MWAFINSIFQFLIGVNKVVEKSLPSEKVAEEKFEIQKPTLEINERIKRQNKIFNKIKNLPDADVKSFVLEFTDLNEKDTEIMVQNITDRIAEHRRDHPLISGWKRFNRK